MRETQVMIVIVAPQAYTDGVYVVKPVILAHGKCDPDVGKMLSRRRIMECAYKDDYNIYVHNTHLDSLRPLLQCMHFMNHNPGIRLRMIAVLHGDAGTIG